MVEIETTLAIIPEYLRTSKWSSFIFLVVQALPSVVFLGGVPDRSPRLVSLKIARYNLATVLV